MKHREFISILTALFLFGCSSDKKYSFEPANPGWFASWGTNENSRVARARDAQSRGQRKPKKNSATDSKLIVTPETALIGKVSMVNANARFAVLNFPVGRLPTQDQRLNIYRNGLKVGEVKVTGPQRDDNTVADITSGDCQPGDQVREN